MTYDCAYQIGDAVHIDQDSSITARVTAVVFRTEDVTLEVSWMHAGTAQVAWAQPWRLTLVGDDR